MLQNYDIDIQNFIKFTSSGIEIASFIQIKEAIINKYKEVYGEDIDLSTGTADGVFVNNIALIINNILQSFKTFYSNLNVDTASGINLDNLCALANIKRKGATKSNASIEVTNLDTVNDYTGTDVIFIDKSGTEWIYEGNLEIEGGTTKSIKVICQEYGKIEAKGSEDGNGWIYQTLEVSNLAVKQYLDANVGEDMESDNSLRLRRSQSSGSEGITVLDSLVGSLLEISGIRDVKIWSNNYNKESHIAKDGTTIDDHDVYIILRYEEGISIDDSVIGSLIYEKMTPGISSIETEDSTYGISKSYNYSPIQNISITDFNKICYWKQSIPVHPTITITLNTFEYFSSDEVKVIGKELINYLNNLSISQDLTSQDILIQTSYADPLFLNKVTYTVNSIVIEDAENEKYINPDTYYNYTTISDGVVGTGTITFTIS